MSDECGPTAEGNLQKEVIGLFALEAREWLNQIQTAHAALEQASERLLQSKLLQYHASGYDEFRRSAAAVPLPAIENMATGLLPLLHSAARQDRATAAHHLGALQEGLNRLATAVQELSGGHATECRESDADRQPVLEAAKSHSSSEDFLEGEQEREAEAGTAPSGPTILDSLRQLHQVRGRSLQPMRDVLEDVIRRAEEHSEEGRDVIDGRTIGRILNDLNDLDEQFLEHMSERVPKLVQMITQLRREPGHPAPSLEMLTPVLHHIDGLRQAVDKVGASTISTFLQGLRAFLLVAAHNQTTDTYQRLRGCGNAIAVSRSTCKAMGGYRASRTSGHHRYPACLTASISDLDLRLVHVIAFVLRRTKVVPAIFGHGQSFSSAPFLAAYRRGTSFSTDPRRAQWMKFVMIKACPASGCLKLITCSERSQHAQ